MPITHSPARPSQKTCISTWEDEGGASLHGRTSLTSTTQEGPELAALGAAVVARWNDLSRDARKALFAAAVAGR
jgi:hypothetical protein